jgi:hypothetical protein
MKIGESFETTIKYGSKITLKIIGSDTANTQRETKHKPKSHFVDVDKRSPRVEKIQLQNQNRNSPIRSLRAYFQLREVSISPHAFRICEAN